MDQLSRREMEVVRLVVDGLTNREIAGRLVISLRTVQSHVAAASRKTGTRSRTQLAVYALRQGLVPLTPTREPPSDPEMDERSTPRHRGRLKCQ